MILEKIFPHTILFFPHVDKKVDKKSNNFILSLHVDKNLE